MYKVLTKYKKNEKMKKKSKGERLGWRHLHEVEPIKLTD